MARGKWHEIYLYLYMNCILSKKKETAKYIHPSPLAPALLHLDFMGLCQGFCQPAARYDERGFFAKKT